MVLWVPSALAVLAVLPAAPALVDLRIRPEILAPHSPRRASHALRCAAPRCATSSPAAAAAAASAEEGGGGASAGEVYEVNIRKPLGLQLEERATKPGGAASVVVSLVLDGSNAAEQGVQAGDIVLATSASIGSGMWEKSTLAGVQSAIATRIDRQVRLRLQRPGEGDGRRTPPPWEQPLAHLYEVELSQPLGLVLAQREGGEGGASRVEVERVEPEGSAHASGVVKGDVLVATSASVGEQMWNKSTLTGANSAISTRFALSSTVRLRFQRTTILGLWAQELAVLARAHGRTGGGGGGGSGGGGGGSGGRGAAAAAAAAAVGGGGGGGVAAAAPTAGAGSAQSQLSVAALRALRSQRRELRLQHPAQPLGEPTQRAMRGLCGLFTTRLGDTSCFSEPSWRSQRQAADARQLRALWRRLGRAPFAIDAKLCNQLMGAALRCGAPVLAVSIFREWRQQSAARPALYGASASSGGAATEMGSAAASAAAGAAAADADSAEGSLSPELQPNAFVYTTLIKAYAACGQRAEALAVLPRMRAEKVTPALHTYTALMDVCAKTGDRQGLLAHFKMIESVGLRPTAATWNVVLNYASKQRSRGMAIDVLRRMRASGVPPNARSYAAAMQASVAGGDVDGAAALLEEALEEAEERPQLTGGEEVTTGFTGGGVRPDVVMLNCLLNGYATALRWREAFSLLERLRDEHGVVPDALSYSLLIRACVRAQLPDEAQNALALMRDAGLTPDVRAYSAVLSAHGRAGRLRDALRLLRQMQAEGVAPNAYSFAALMEACVVGKQPETAISVFEQMEDQGLPADAATFTLLVRAYCALPKAIDGLGKARAVIGRMKAAADAGDADAAPNAVTYNALIEGSIAQAEWAHALDALRMMLADNISPTRGTFRLVSWAEPRRRTAGGAPSADLIERRLRFLQRVLDVFSEFPGRQVNGELLVAILTLAEAAAPESAVEVVRHALALQRDVPKLFVLKQDQRRMIAELAENILGVEGEEFYAHLPMKRQVV